MKFEIRKPSQGRPKRRAAGHDALFERLRSNPGQWFAITSQPASERLRAKMFSAAALRGVQIQTTIQEDILYIRQRVIVPAIAGEKQ